MSNGVTAHALLAPNAAIEAPVESTGPDELGAAVLAAAIEICRAGEELATGVLTAATRRAGAERIYHVFELGRGLPAPEFASVARVQGLAMMRSCLDADFYRRHGPGGGEVVMGNIINEILFAVGEVAQFERQMVN